jgi:integrase
MAMVAAIQHNTTPIRRRSKPQRLIAQSLLLFECIRATITRKPQRNFRYQRSQPSVFKLTDEAGIPLESLWVSKKVADIGEAAGVIVNKQEGKYASCHDLRRAFGTRWAKKVMPAILQRLMRHGDIQTTMSYYVDLDAAEIADTLWRGFEAEKTQNGNTCGNTQQFGATDFQPVNEVSP